MPSPCSRNSVASERHVGVKPGMRPFRARLGRLAPLLLVLILCMLVSGCAAVVIGGAATGGALAAHDRRDFRTLIDDSSIERIAATRLRRDERFVRSNIKPVAFNGILLLAGEVDQEPLREEAERLLAAVEDVRHVVNELVVQPMTGPLSRTRNALLTGQVNTALLGIDDLPGFDPTRVKVTSVRREVYLMGLVTAEEARRSAEVARRVRGVEQVFMVFEYLDPEPEPPPQ